MQTLFEISKKLSLTAKQTDCLQGLQQGSPFATRLLLKDQELLTDLLNNLQICYQLEDMKNFLTMQDIRDENSLKKALRKLRQSVIVRIIARDLAGLADLHEVMQTTTHLAECVINTSIMYLHTWLVDSFGHPLNYQGSPQSLIVIGMGKLGGRELNVSSDIDLIFAYESDGQTNGEHRISNQDFFTRLGKKLIAAIDEITEDGFVFRVDMRLRPFGSEGVLVSHLDALEEYYQNNGREWERYAWIKGREVTGGSHVSKLLKPFVFRKYLDYGAFASMRDLKMQIQRDVNRRDLHDNIKLGRGGIREVEFIAQVFQLIRGGQDPSLQVIPTLEVLKLLQAKNLLPEKTVQELTDAYIFLRNLEHRLMYIEDAQTQDLPKSEETRTRIALMMGFADWHHFLQVLNQYRGCVQAHFDETFSEDEQNEAKTQTYEIARLFWNGAYREEDALDKLRGLGFLDVEEAKRQLDHLHQGHRYRQLPELSRQRLNALMPLLIETATLMHHPDVALTRTMGVLEAICRRASYLALLTEYPNALKLIVKLCSASAWCAQYLTQYPIVLDELLDERNLYAQPDFVVMRQQLQQTMLNLEGDVEQQMDAMRHFKHAAVFRFAAQDIAGKLPLETLSDYLSHLADMMLDLSLQTIWKSFRFKHRETPKFAIIGYGKLGGKELGYASDLDIIFLFDDDAAQAGENYARFAQRINHWFNTLTTAGLLYETDLQLRPDGNSGLLVSSLQAFQDYQQHRAWVWEHQALTRARFVAGDGVIGKAFEQIRIDIMRQPRDTEKLRQEVIEMRERMRQAQHLTADTFDLKHSVGGIIDVEFLVQYLVLKHVSTHADLTKNSGNIALLHSMGGMGLIDASLAQQVAEAYRHYRRLQHAARLQGEANGKVAMNKLASYANATRLLWQQVFAL